MKISDDPLKSFVKDLVAKSVSDLLKRGDLIDVLHIMGVPGACTDETMSELTKYFEDDNNIAQVLTALLNEPKIKRRKNRDAPQYKEYSTVYHAYTILGLNQFCAGVHKTIFPGTFSPNKSRNVLLCRITDANPINPIIAEAFTRILSTAMDSRTFNNVARSFGPYVDEFFEGMTYQVGCAPIQKTLLRMLDHPISSDLKKSLNYLVPQMLQQLFPTIDLYYSDESSYALQNLQESTVDFKFDSMVGISEVLTHIHEQKGPETIGAYVVNTISKDPLFAKVLVEACLQDVKALPNSFTVESYGLKVLHFFLNRSKCGCVAYSVVEINGKCGNEAELPAIWDEFNKLSEEFLQCLLSSGGGASSSLPFEKRSLSMVQLQLVKLLIPIVSHECVVQDSLLIQLNVFETLVRRMIEQPRGNIFQAGVNRVFSVFALSDTRKFNDVLYQQVLTKCDVLNLILQHAKFSPTVLELSRSFKKIFELAGGDVVSPEAKHRWEEFLEDVLHPTDILWNVSSTEQQQKLLARKPFAICDMDGGALGNDSNSRRSSSPGKKKTSRRRRGSIEMMQLDQVEESKNEVSSPPKTITTTAAENSSDTTAEKESTEIIEDTAPTDHPKEPTVQAVEQDDTPSVEKLMENDSTAITEQITG